MQDEHNELGDIILNRSEKGHSRKKVLVGIGALLSVLIIIVIAMGRFSDDKPVAMPALPSTISSASSSSEDDDIDRQLAIVAQKHVPAASSSAGTVAVTAKIKPVVVDADENEVVIIDEPKHTAPQKVVTPKADTAAKPSHVTGTQHHSASAKPEASAAKNGDVYIQVGSFSRYKPAKGFLERIEKSGYAYRFHRVVIRGEIKNKVLVGPFKSRADAKAHLTDVRKKIESGAFIYTIKEK